MTNILTKPYTDTQYADFAVFCNENSKHIVEGENALYALSDFEILQNSAIVDISETDEYKAKVLVEQNATKKADLQTQIDELDKKRVRAGFEPSIKDDTTGQTYLEFYTAQIQDLRAQIAAL